VRRELQKHREEKPKKGGAIESQGRAMAIRIIIKTFFVRTLIFGVADERVVETGLKPVSTHIVNRGSPKSVTRTDHEPSTLVDSRLLTVDKKEVEEFEEFEQHHAEIH